MTSPVSVVRLGLADTGVEEVPVGEAVEAEAAGEIVRLMLASALDSPAGEHPTKSGTVSLTLAHSSLLNWIAATQRQKCLCQLFRANILVCSAVLHVV
jgi:hypothetical protein